MEAEISRTRRQAWKDPRLKQAMMQALLDGRCELPVQRSRIFGTEAAHAERPAATP